jgi:hypothetical protein
MMDGKPKFEEFKTLEQFHTRLQPYQYFKLYYQMHKYEMEIDTKRFEKLYTRPKELVTQKAFVNTSERAFTIPEMRIINIDEDVMPMLEDTKPDYSELRLKYPAMFINQRVCLGETTINGFLLIDYEQIEKDHPDMGWVRDEFSTPLRVLCIGINRKYNFEFYSIHPVMPDMPGKEAPIFIDEEDEQKLMAQLSRKVVELACNLINLLVNDEKDVEEVECIIPEAQNKKRILRGKLPLMNTTTLRIGGTLKRYITEYRQMRGTIGIRYHVGGFWRHYNSDFYKDMKGKKEWIYPHYRGMKNMPLRIKKFVNVEIGKV